VQVNGPFLFMGFAEIDAEKFAMWLCGFSRGSTTMEQINQLQAHRIRGQ
jgi:hypothetical protein